MPRLVDGPRNSLKEVPEDSVAGLLSVMEVLSRLSELDGMEVAVYGALTLEFEGNRLDHIPRAEAPPDDFGWTDCSLWVDLDPKFLDADDPSLQGIRGRHVQILGELHGPDPKYGGCGHMSLWPAEIIIRSISKLRSS